MALSWSTKYIPDREMFYKTLAAVIVASVFLPACVQAGVIQYQEVALRYTVEAGVTDFNAGEFDGEANATRIESNPQNFTANASLNGVNSSAGLTFDLDEDNNTFSLNGAIAAISNVADNIGANVSATVVLFIDFTIESDSSDPVELLFTADSSFLGLEEIVDSTIALARVSSRLTPESTRIFPDDPFSRTAGSPVLAGLGFGDRTQSILVVPGQPYSVVSTLEINNRLSANTFVDGAGDIRVSTSLAVREVPEPPLLAALAIGCLILRRRRSMSKAGQV